MRGGEVGTAEIERSLRLLPYWWVRRWAWLSEALWVIYLIETRGLTIGQVLLLDAVFFGSQLLAEIPTGVVADDAHLFDSPRAVGRGDEFASVDGRLNGLMALAIAGCTVVGGLMVVVTPLSWPIVASALLALAATVIAWRLKEPPSEGRSRAGTSVVLLTIAIAVYLLWHRAGDREIALADAVSAPRAPATLRACTEASRPSARVPGSRPTTRSRPPRCSSCAR